MIRFLFVVLLFAAMVYLLVRLMDRRPGKSGPVIRKRPPQPPRRTVAPDDDEEFLRDLDKKRKHPDDPE